MKRFVITLALSVGMFAGTFAQNWDNSMYADYTFETFSKYPPVHKIIAPGNIDYALINAALFYETNRQRVLNNKPRYKHSNACENAAFLHSQDMVNFSFFSHTSTVPGKASMSDRMSLAGLPSAARAENIAYRYLSGDTYLGYAKKAIDQWMNSTGHRQNILNERYLYLGCGAYTGNGSAIYATQNFSSVNAPKDRDYEIKANDNGITNDTGNNTGTTDNTDNKTVDTQEKKKTETNENLKKTNIDDNKDKDNTEKKSERRQRTRYPRLSFQWGVGMPYNLGATENLSEFSFDRRLFTAEANGMFGINYNYRSGKNSIMAGFGRLGTIGLGGIDNFVDERLLIDKSIDMEHRLNTYKEVEVGFMRKRWFRISTGVGVQTFRLLDSGSYSIGYFTATTGFSIKIGTNRIEILTTALTGGGLDRTYLRPTISLTRRYNFLRI